MRLDLWSDLVCPWRSVVGAQTPDSVLATLRRAQAEPRSRTGAPVP